MISYERVYILQLASQKFYVGSTFREMHCRYKEHAEGWGSRWTSSNAPVRCVCWMRVPNGMSTKVENEVTRTLMSTRGWGAVRGGDWVFVRCKHRSWLPHEMRSLGPTDVLPLHRSSMGHLAPESRRLIESFELACGLENPEHLNADAFPEVTLSGLANHFHHVDPSHATPVALRAQ